MRKFWGKGWRAAYIRTIISVAFALAVAGLAGPAQAAVNSANSPYALAATSCKTIQDDYSASNNVHQRLMSFTVTTYFCYNGSWVTYHNTWYTYNISGWGAAAGWQFDDLSTNTFNCSVADGSRHTCSGNDEILQAHFTACILKVGCVGHWDPTIEEVEYYDGSWWTAEDGHFAHSGG
jgi:hypothetical protein